MKKTRFTKRIAVFSAFVMAGIMMLSSYTTAFAADSVETKEVVVQKLEDNSKYNDVFIGYSVLGGANHGVTLMNEANFEYKVYFSDGTSSVLNTSNCEAINVLKQLSDAGKVYDEVRPIVYSCNNKDKLIAISYVSSEGDNDKYSTALNQNGTYYNGFSGFAKGDANLPIDETQAGMDDDFNYSTETVGGQEWTTATLDSTLIVKYVEDYSSSIAGDLINKNTGEVLLKNVNNMYFTGEIGKYYIFTQFDDNDNFLGLYKVSYKTTVTSASDTSIAVTDANGVLPEGTKMTSAKVESGTVYETAKAAAKKAVTNMGNFAAVEINLTNGDTELHQLDGRVAVTMKMPITISAGNSLKVYRVDGENLVECKATVDGDKVTFETDHFSTFVFVEAKATSASPKTADATVGMSVVSLIAIVSILGIVVISRKKKEY